MLTGTITKIERRQNTVAGNPRWYITFGEIAYRTASDAQFAFEIDDTLVGKRMRIALRVVYGEPFIAGMEPVVDTE